MAKYGVNLPSQVPEPKPDAEPTESTTANSKIRSTYLVTAYAFAVAITPEFNFLGIPKVRLTDLLVPLLFLAYLDGERAAKLTQSGKPGKTRSALRSLCWSLMLWDFGALLLWGKAKLTPGLFYLAKRIIYILVALFTSRCVRDTKTWQSVVRMLVFSSPILNFFVLRELRTMQELGGIYATSEGMRASGIIANQQTSTSLFVVIVCCVTLGAWDSFKDATWRMGTWVALITGAAAILATGSRGGMACLAFSVVIFCLMNPRKIGMFLAPALIAGSAAWFFTPDAIQTRLASLFPETQATFQGLTGDRDLLPEYGSSSVADRALTVEWFFKDIMPRSGLMGLGAGWKKLGAVDNCFLTEWMYHGLIGLLLFLRLLLALVAYCFRCWRDSRDPVEKGVASGVATALVVMLISCMQGDTFYLIRPMECLAMLIGLVAARKTMAR